MNSNYNFVTGPAPNGGIELLYTRDCRWWQETAANLVKSLKTLGIKDEPKLICIDTMEQAELYNFFASPTIHINGVDIDRHSRRTGKRGLGYGRPYRFNKQTFLAPPVELIKQGIEELYFNQ
ncbi:MAG: hypothetical protein WC621_00415 [Patescibacteria group bacterium]